MAEGGTLARFKVALLFKWPSDVNQELTRFSVSTWNDIGYFTSQESKFTPISFEHTLQVFSPACEVDGNAGAIK